MTSVHFAALRHLILGENITCSSVYSIQGIVSSIFRNTLYKRETIQNI